MDSHALQVLEFDAIRERLAKKASCSLGKRRAEAIRISKDAEWIRERLKETSEAREAMTRHGPPPFGGLTDVGELLPKANAGSPLAGNELLRVADMLRASRRMLGFFANVEQGVFRRLEALVERLHDHRDVEERIEGSLDDEGEVRDDASDELRALWRKHISLHEKLQAIVNKVLAREADGAKLQERLVVQRDGRHCVPIRASAQGAFPGIMHDRSDSGQTVFMEPLEAVGPGNELRETELAIDEEKRRILRELTFMVAEIADDIRSDLKTLGVLDFIFAKAALAQEMQATEPGIAEQGTFQLVRARHPLLTGEVVPVDVWIGKGFDTLVITGPNTGGKTVTLRTVGLLNAMFQAGLHIPAATGSEMSIFEEVFADIGDEQGIEQSLSTFSSHMTQIIKVLQKLEARDRRKPGSVNALVLLDEIGAGTDPTEGSCLARAILEELQALGARTIATTHYNELKTFAYETKGMENASVEFDVKTLQPTYHLVIGEAGSSNAFDIAQRLGLPRVIARKARSLLDSEDAAVADVIQRMERTRRKLRDEADMAAEERGELEELQQQYVKELEDLSARRRKALDEGFEEARQIVARAEEKARAIIADLQRQSGQSKVTEARRQEVAELRREVEDQAAQHARQAEPEAQPEEEPEEVDFPVEVGDAVRVLSLRRDGILLRMAGGERAVVEVGKMRVEVSRSDLAPPGKPIAAEHKKLAEKLQAVKQLSVSQEINLIGTTVDEATEELEKYLDDAFLAGHESVRIIHGKGTGALRRGVHAYLKQNRHVSGFELAERHEGGDGATVARL